MILGDQTRKLEKHQSSYKHENSGKLYAISNSMFAPKTFIYNKLSESCSQKDSEKGKKSGSSNDAVQNCMYHCKETPGPDQL